ncbi:MAG: hypothetical protein ACQETH_06955 [Candidatus Rifleibacteriota bacterium]
MKKISVEKNTAIPIIVMVCFTFLLLLALVLRVYQADRDLGLINVAKKQARLASEAGVHYAAKQMYELINQNSQVSYLNDFSADYFINSLKFDKWINFGQKSNAFFRIIRIREVSASDKPETPLKNEELRFQVVCEGKSGGNQYSTVALIQFYDLAATFCVFSSLNEYYYGNPIQPWVQNSGSLSRFVKANNKIFESGKIDKFGVCHDPQLLYSLFKPSGTDVFNPVAGGKKLAGNYGTIWRKSGDSPAKGPIYCSKPIVVDSHKFYGPIQTALYLYRRENSQPGIVRGNSLVALNSSSRVQKAADRLEGKNSSHLLVDQDTSLYRSYIPEWRPDFNFLKKLARDRGIYIDKQGQGFQKGKKIDLDFHPGEEMIYSDSYLTANSDGYVQDQFNNKYIVLSTETKFDGFNNLSNKNLKGAQVIYSERSIYLRGEIGSDLVVVTPKHIFLTGPTNIDSNLRLFLIAGAGTAASTVDLESYINENNPDSEFIDAAREWLVNALVYKPGAGVYTSKSRQQKGSPVNFRNLFAGRSLRVHINGGCIGGDLKRWQDNFEPDGLEISWNKRMAEGLPVKPFSLNILRMRTLPEG